MEKFAINYIYQILKKFIMIIRSIVWIIMNNHMILLFKFIYWKKCYIWKRLKMFPILKWSIDEEHIDKNCIQQLYTKTV